MKTLRILLVVMFLSLGLSFEAGAQFRQYGVSRSGLQDVNSQSTIVGAPGENLDTLNTSNHMEVKTDTTAGFSLKRMFRGYARKDTLTPGYLFFGSILVPGSAQIYNRDYWKLPIFYGGIAAGVTGGILCNEKWVYTQEESYRTGRTLCYVGAGLFYWASLLDGVVSFKTSYRPPVPAKAAIYSALLPGLGQAYVGDWWKIPIWVGGFVGCGYAYHYNNMEYQRFNYLSNVIQDPTSGYIGSITLQQAQYYRDLYRKYRDYSLVATLLVYVLNIIDANVFAYMADFDVSDNIASVEVAPTVISPDYQTLASGALVAPSAVGLKLDVKF